MKRFNLSEWAVHHPALILFLILAISVAGFFSFRSLGRAEDPNFTIKNVIVTAIWPGATAQEMQDQVADPIEKKLQELPWFDKVVTYAKPGFAAMNVGFRDNTPAREVPQLFYQLRKKLDDIRGQLPRDLIGPSVNDEYGDVDSILYMLTGDGADFAQLKKVAEGLRQQLLKVPGVTKVNLYGVQDERIYVEFSHAKLATLGIPPQALFASLQRQNAVVPAGTVETNAHGSLCASREPSTGQRRWPKPRSRRAAACSVSATSRPSPVASKIRPTPWSASAASRRLASGSSWPRAQTSWPLDGRSNAAADAFMQAVPQGIDIEQVADQPKVVDHAIGEFEHSFLEALGIVLLVSFVSLGWRTGIVVALSVPLVLAITFAVMIARP